MRPDVSRLFCRARGRTPLSLYVYFLGDILHAIPVWICVFCRTPAVTVLQHLGTSVSSCAGCSGHLPNSPSDSRESRHACSQPAQVEAWAYCAYLRISPG